MGYGYLGKVLFVNLTNQKIEIVDIEDKIYEQFIGGYGLGAKFIFDRQRAQVDPLGEESIFGLTSGLLTGTGSLFSGRFMAVGKSPLTGGWGDSNCGGKFSPEIKKAGFDAIFFTGISDKPVYLLIMDEKIEIKDATDLWGLDTIQTEEILKEKWRKNIEVASIGQSGEKLSLISGIVTDRGRIAARSGLGAVMGSKKLKAVVIKSNGSVSVKDKEKIKLLNKEFLSRHKKGGAVLERNFLGKVLNTLVKILRRSSFQPRQDGELFKAILSKYGTSGITAFAAEGGDSPVKNWKGIGFLDFPLIQSSKISDDEVIKYQRKRYNCYSCPLGCGGLIEFNGTKYKLSETHKPEYETLCSFGTLLLNNNLESIFYLNDLCNRAGIDTISVGASVSFAIECFEEGLITKSDTDGIELKWGDSESIIKLTENIIKREGFGDILADGIKKASEKIGEKSKPFAIHAGGQELPMHDPRYDPGYGLAYVTDPTPGRHTISSYTHVQLSSLHNKFKEARRFPVLISNKDKYNNKGKAAMQAFHSKFVQVGNCAGICMFGLESGGDAPLFEWINAATGWNFSNHEYLEIGERILTLRQAFNVREGIIPNNVKLPDRVLGNPPFDKGPLKGITLDMENLAKDYYKEMFWNYENGKPLITRLKELKLDNVIKELYPDFRHLQNSMLL